MSFVGPFTKCGAQPSTLDGRLAGRALRQMTQPPTQYKPTFFDRHGPEAAGILTARVWGLAMGLLTFAILSSQRGLTLGTVLGGICGGILVGNLGPLLGSLFGGMWNTIAVNGGSTPSTPQYSRVHALVMQGKIDEALALIETTMSADPTDIQARIFAADLYLRERNNAERAAELLREAHAVRPMSAGDDVYIANRLVDLYVGPLNTPYKAIRELRRIVARYGNTSAANHARLALAALKERHAEQLK